MVTKLEDVEGGYTEEQSVQNNIEGPFDRTYCSCAEDIWKVFAKELKDVEEPVPAC